MAAPMQMMRGPRGGQNDRWALLAIICFTFLVLMWFTGPGEDRTGPDVSVLSAWGEEGRRLGNKGDEEDSSSRREAIEEGGRERDERGKGKEDVEDSELCDRNNYPAAWELKSDQLTILINGFAESRLSLLQKHVRMYSSHPFVNSIYILWSNISTPSEVLEDSDFESLGAPIYLVRQQSKSLNDRFLPRSYIKTRAVMICDDDITVDSKSLGFALDVWRGDQDRIVGFFPRSHAYELDSKSWVYAKPQGKYSIMLTKLMILATEYLYLYTCEMPKGVKEYVDEGMNCEDIAMNFVVSSHSGKGPLLVEGKPRDWGDTRNSAEDLSIGALSGRTGHRKDRGDCIREFQKFWLGMELKFSYIKVVSKLDEEVVCDKFGYMIDCDKQVTSKRDARRYVGENVVSYTHRYAYATFMPSCSHLNLSLLLAQTLRSSGTVHDLVLLVDPSCAEAGENHIVHEHFDVVVHLETPKGADYLNQLGKLSAWRLTDYAKVVYLEVDSLVLANLDHLFELPELAAAPRVFVPGKFSTGLFVLEPSNVTYTQLVKSLGKVRIHNSRRKQYLLNSYFSGWFYLPVQNRLPARYNTPVVFSKQLRVPIWFDVNRAFELLGPPMVVRFGSAKLSSRHVDRAYGIANSWCVSRFRLFEDLQDNEFHPLDDEKMTYFSWLPVEKWNASDLTWPPKLQLTPTSLAFSIEKSYSREAFVTVLWGNERFSLAGWAESYYYHHSAKTRRKVVLLILSSLEPTYYDKFRSYFDEVRVVDPLVLNGRPAHGSFTLLHLWNQTDYDKLVYVTSSSLFVDNCNGLLDYSPFAAVPSIFPPDSFSTEVMVIQPDQQTYNILRKKLLEYDYPSQPVEQFLNGYHNDWYQSSILHRINPSYSVNMAFDTHLRHSPLPPKVMSFSLDWLPDEEANVTKLWKKTVCDLRSTARKGNIVSSLCEAEGVKVLKPDMTSSM